MTDAEHEWPADDEWARGPKPSADGEHAAVLRRRINLEIWRLENDLHETLNSPERAAIERAIELLEREAAKREGRSVLNRFGYPR